MDATNRARTEEFVDGLHREGYLERFMAKEALESAAHGMGSRLGSTTHGAAIDSDGACATLTCSDGSCFGVRGAGPGLDLDKRTGGGEREPPPLQPQLPR